MDKNRSMWLPIIASVGVGAATYYTISKSNNQTISQTLEKIMPVVSQMSMTSGDSIESQQSQGSQDMGMN